MVVADGAQQVALCLVKIVRMIRPAAAILKQESFSSRSRTTASGNPVRRASGPIQSVLICMTPRSSEPSVFEMHQSDASAFNRLDRRQHARRQMIHRTP